jgi:hypothetical protein
MLKVQTFGNDKYQLHSNEIKSRLSVGNSWLNSVESFVFLSDKQKRKDLSTNLQFYTKPPIVCTCTCMHERETWSHIHTQGRT